ncbi:MAG: MJ1477/TM1410 family putative glycoside hydrolase [Opitutales bacterium]
MFHLVRNTWLLALLFSPIWSLSGAETFKPRSMAYLLQADKLDKRRPQAIEKLANCGRDLIVIDYSYDGDVRRKWTPKEIERIRGGLKGRKVVAYLSIGEAEDYRGYWQAAWDRDRDGKPDPGAPAFLESVNPDWEGNYKVRFWRRDWQDLILKYLDQIIEQGFDGVYLDLVAAFEHFEEDNGHWIDHRKNPETKKSYREDMIAWVTRIAKHARDKKGQGFLIIPQNGSQLLENGLYLNLVDAIGVEDLLTNGNRLQKRDETNDRLPFIKRMLEAGKPVLLVEYGRKEAVRDKARQQAKEQGFLLLLTDRNLKSLGTSHAP